VFLIYCIHDCLLLLLDREVGVCVCVGGWVFQSQPCLLSISRAIEAGIIIAMHLTGINSLSLVTAPLVCEINKSEQPRQTSFKLNADNEHTTL